MKKFFLVIVLICLLAGSMFGQNYVLNLIKDYYGEWTSAPTDTNFGTTTNAPLIGNGDLGVVIVGNIDSMTAILDKNEFWSQGEGQVKAMVRMSISASSMSSASYNAKQNLLTADVTQTFAKDGNTINMTSWVQATDTKANLYISKIVYTGSSSKTVSVSLARGNENTYSTSGGSSGDVLYIDVRGDSSDTINGMATCKVRTAVRVIGAAGSINSGVLSFTIQPGNTYTLVTCVMSNYDDSNYTSNSISSISSKTQGDIDALKKAHQIWWNSFYSKSFLEIPNKTLEKSYYASMYLMASASRAGEIAPGLFGPWIAKNAAWKGDYHLNYNYEVPFLFTIATNHLELCDNYDKPVIDWIAKGQAAASSAGYQGVYYQVGIGPLPNGSSDTNFHNQKVNALFAATNMAIRFNSTKDLTYGNTVYPFLKQVCIFWQNYLTWDSGTSKYYIYQDSTHEGDSYPQTNSILSLGFLRLVLLAAIHISEDLGVDSDYRSTWQNRLSNLAPFPTQTRNSQTVFRYTSEGRDWCDDNSIGIQHIYPGGQISIGGDSTLLSYANNMVGQMARWHDNNGTNTFYPAAARVGYSASTILSNLTDEVNWNALNNLHIYHGGGGIENLNTVPATLAEMLCLSDVNNKIRVFANWPANSDAKFGDFRADEAFLVSSAIVSNTVQYVRVISEKGKNCTVVNPWPGSTIRIYRNGSDSGTLSGTDLYFTTSAGEVIHLATNGTSYSTILDRMPSTDWNLAQFGTITDQYGDSPSGEEKDKAFDNRSTTKFLTSHATAWIKYQFNDAQAYAVNKYAITSANDVPDRDPLNWTLAGSNDDSNYTTVDTRSNEDFPNRYQTRTFSFSNSTTYKYYRLTMTNNTGSVLQVADIALYGTAGSAPTTKMIALKCIDNNSYVCSENGGTNRMNCNRSSNGAWEEFLVVDGGGGKIGLKGYASDAATNKFVCSENGGSAMICNRDSLGSWEYFYWITNPDGTISLKADVNSKYVTGSSNMWCTAGSIDSAQKFLLKKW